MPTRGRLADRSFALTVLTFVLLTPPIVTIFNVPVLVLGVPLLHLYCFAVWLGAIVIGARIAARLVDEPAENTGAPRDRRDDERGGDERGGDERGGDGG